MNRFLRVPLFALSISVAACATTGGMRSEPLHSGITRQFVGDFPTVLRAARDAVTNAGLAVDTFDQPNDSTAVIGAKKGSTIV